jgi:hypothetical protein
LQIFDGRVTAFVITNASNHRHARAEAGCGDGLIGSFAARSLKEFVHDDGFSRGRNAPSAQHKIGVDPTDNDDVETLPWHATSCAAECWFANLLSA